MNRQQTRHGRSIAAALLVTAAVGLSACSSITTQNEYAPSDGVRVVLNADVTVQNLMVITAAQGKPGAVQGGIVNNGPADVSVAIGELSFDVASQSTVLLGGTHGEDALFESVTVAPGATLPITVAIVGGEPQTVPIPVLDGTLPEYTDLVPQAN